MSSHHIVRDEQEPALVVTAANLLTAEVQQLLEWSPVLVAFEDAIPDLLCLKVKMDVALVKTAHLADWQEKLSIQAPLKLLSHQQEHDQYSDAILLLSKNGHQSINFLHDLDRPNLIALIQELMPIMADLALVFYSKTTKSSLVSANFRKWFPARRKVVVTPISSSGWFYQLPGQQKILASDQANIELEDDGLLEIENKSGYLLIEELW